MTGDQQKDALEERQKEIDEALATSDACWRMEQEVLQRQLDEARAEVERLRARVRSVDRSTAYEGTAFSDGESSQEAEVERLRADLARCREVQRATAEGWRHEVAEVAAIVGAPPHTAELAACVRAEVERLRGDLAQTQELVRLAKMITRGLQNERDEVRAEVERLRAERDKQIAEAASWRATARDKGSSSREVAKERDEARAEVERLRAVLAKRTADLDAMHGTPCEQIRHEQEVADLRAEVERLRALLDEYSTGDE